jgi:hypothetical protein
VPDELERRFQRENRLRFVRWCVGILVSIVLVVAGFQIYFQVQYGTLAWWSAPTRIPYCGWTYFPVSGQDVRSDALSLRAREGDDSVANRAALGKMVEVTSVPPFFRPVFSAPEAFPDSAGKCADPIFYESGSGQLIEYGSLTS